MEGALRFSEIAQAVPELSDRLLSERMKELEGRGMVERNVISGPPLRVEYSLSQMGRELEPALAELAALGHPLARRAQPLQPASNARPASNVRRAMATTADPRSPPDDVRRSSRSGTSGSSGCGSPTSSAS